MVIENRTTVGLVFERLAANGRVMVFMVIVVGLSFALFYGCSLEL